jgi:hypothetical protein
LTARIEGQSFHVAAKPETDLFRYRHQSVILPCF